MHICNIDPCIPSICNWCSNMSMAFWRLSSAMNYLLGSTSSDALVRKMEKLLPSSLQSVCALMLCFVYWLLFHIQCVVDQDGPVVEIVSSSILYWWVLQIGISPNQSVYEPYASFFIFIKWPKYLKAGKIKYCRAVHEKAVSQIVATSQKRSAFLPAYIFQLEAWREYSMEIPTVIRIWKTSCHSLPTSTCTTLVFKKPETWWCYWEIWATWDVEEKIFV